MTPVEAQWGDLRATMFVQGSDGTVWRVSGVRLEPHTLDTRLARFEVATHMLLMHRISIRPHAHKENGPLSHLLDQHAIDHAAPKWGWSPHIHVPRR
jgi:hypothetical protein